MMLRKALLSAMLLGAFAAPAFAADTTTAPVGGAAGMMEHKNPADTDGDGFLSKSEFLAAQEKRFAEIDTNSDGKISKEEMKAFHESKKGEWAEKKADWKAKHDADKAAAPAAGK